MQLLPGCNYLLNSSIIIYMSDSRQKTITKVTVVGSIVNLLLVVFKFFAGIVGRSSALVADAVHSLSDFISDIIVLVFVKIAGKPVDEDHEYGHGKYETLAAIIIGLILAIAGFLLLYEGVVKIIDFCQGKPLEMPNALALVAAGVSIVLKEGLFQYTIIWGKKIDSQALIANAWHHRSDALTSIAAFIGIGGAMLLGDKWVVLDPIAAAVVSLYIIKASFELMKPGIDELLEKSLPAEERKDIESIIMTEPGVMAMHKLRTRRVGESRVIDVHVKMDGDMSLTKAHDIATNIEHKLRERFGTSAYVYIHMEPA